MIPGLHETNRNNWIFIRTLPSSIHSYSLSEVYPPDRWDQQRSIFQCDHQKTYGELEAVGALSFEDSSGTGFVVILGIVARTSAIVRLIRKTRYESLERIYNDVENGLHSNNKRITPGVAVLGSSMKRVCVHICNERVFGQSMFVIDVGIADELCPFTHQEDDMTELDSL